MPEAFVTEDSVMAMLRSAFRADAALDVQVCFEVHVADVVVHAQVDRGLLTVHRGATSDADAVIDAGPTLEPLLTGPAAAQVNLIGPPELLTWFLDMFHQSAPPIAMAA